MKPLTKKTSAILAFHPRVVPFCRTHMNYEDETGLQVVAAGVWMSMQPSWMQDVSQEIFNPALSWTVHIHLQVKKKKKKMLLDKSLYKSDF